MNDLRISRFAWMALLLPVLAFFPAVAQSTQRDQSAQPEVTRRLYDLDVAGVDDDDAERQLVKKCYEEGWDCKTDWSGRHWLTVAAPQAAHEWFLARVSEWDTPPPTVVFRLYLLSALPESRVPESGRPGSERWSRSVTLTPDAQAALDDLIEFLPPSRFALDGTSVVTLQPGEHAQTVLAGSMGYRAQLKFETNGAPGKIRVYFALSDVYAGKDERGNPISRHRDVLENAFGMGIGETLVVGTSQAARDESESLIVVLSAGS